MPFSFRNLSVRRKLTVIPMVTTTVTLAVAGLLYLTFDFFSLRRDLKHDLGLLAETLGTTSEAAVIFNDEAAATQIVRSLSLKPNVVAAFLYGTNDQLLIEYDRDSTPGAAISRPAATLAMTSGLLVEERPIVVNGQRAGRIVIYADQEELRARLRRAATIGALVVLVSLAIGLLLSSTLQRLISEPVVHLADTSRRISEDKDYSVRATVTSGDELGVLTQAFNEMLDQIESRDRALTRLSSNVQQLYKLSTAMQEPLSLVDHLAHVLESARQVVAIDRLALWVLSSDTRQLMAFAGAGYDEEDWSLVRDVRIAITESRELEDVFSGGVPVLFHEDRPIPSALLGHRSSTSGVKCLLAVPMIARGKPIGVLTADNRETCEQIQRNTADLLQIFASHAAVAVENARLFRELEEKGSQLEIASRHKSQFLANMSHELRTPLNAILGYTELIRDQIYGQVPAKIQEVLERVEISGRHLLGLINHVLDLSKIEAGHLTLSTTDYSMRELVHVAVASLESLAAEKGVQLHARVSPSLPTGVGDERRLTQVLLNLIGNAIKFTDYGEISVEASSSNGSFCVAISDTGAGIAAADRERIFEPFQQGDSSSTKQKGGTGLGLPIARTIVEMHGGHIRVESEEGRGSLLNLRFLSARI